jgi:hypothetical protein
MLQHELFLFALVFDVRPVSKKLVIYGLHLIAEDSKQEFGQVEIATLIAQTGGAQYKGSSRGLHGNWEMLLLRLGGTQAL